MTTKTQQSSPPEANGNEPENNTLVEAIAYEQAIAKEAQRIRDDWGATEKEDIEGLILGLLPLLRRPIPPGFIVSTKATKGKPYDSTGIKSLQVQIDRMDNVLTPLLWAWQVEFEHDGKLAHVKVAIGKRGEQPLVLRQARGGVDRANTLGNLFKGSETNAAKLAFARTGPGHEVYLGATDFDPDTDEDAAKAQESDSSPQLPADEKLPPEFVKMLGEKVDKAGLSQQLPMKLRSFGTDAIQDLTVAQGRALWTWAEEPDG